jgi:hypothetical protein
MTAQAPDTVEVRGRAYAIAGASGSGLFSPAEHGLVTMPLTTANWRGYQASYAVRRGVLHLARLEIGLHPEARGDRAPVLFGAGPDEEAAARLLYRFADAPIPYSGGLLLGDDFVWELYVHMGFHPAWKFRNVLELTLEEGRVVREHDRSEEMAEIRDRVAAGQDDPDASPDMVAWIQRTFELDYSRTLPPEEAPPPSR